MSQQAFAVAGSQPLQQLLSWSSSCAGISQSPGLCQRAGAGWGAAWVAEHFWARKRPGKLLLISLFICGSCAGSAHRVCPRCRKMLQCAMTGGCTSAGRLPCVNSTWICACWKTGQGSAPIPHSWCVAISQQTSAGYRICCNAGWQTAASPPPWPCGTTIFLSHHVAYVYGCVCQHSLFLLTPLSPFLLKWV